MSTQQGHATDHEQHEAEVEGIRPMEGESVLQNRHPGWGLWWKHLAVAALALIFGLSAGTDGIMGGLVIAGALVGYVAFARSKSRYIVTDERVKADIGFISSTTREFRISDIQGIDTKQSIIGSLFSIGDIEVRTADGASIWWNGVPDHEDVAHTIRQHQRQYDQTMDRK